MDIFFPKPLEGLPGQTSYAAHTLDEEGARLTETIFWSTGMFSAFEYFSKNHPVGADVTRIEIAELVPNPHGLGYVRRNDLGAAT
jgi:hypothetical protein